MLKFAGAVLLIVAGALTGFSRASSLTKRVTFFEDFLFFINETETQIKYSSQPLCPMMFNMNFGKSLAEFANMLLYELEQESDFFDAWQSAVNSIPYETGLTTDDRRLINEFGAGLGKTDTDGQTAHCTICASAVADRLNTARNDKTVKSKLYKSLGILSGAACALLIL